MPVPRPINPIKLRIELVNRDNDIYETQHLEIKGKDWKKYSVILSPKATEAKSRLRITMETAGTLDMEHISLFPGKKHSTIARTAYAAIWHKR